MKGPNWGALRINENLKTWGDMITDFLDGKELRDLFEILHKESPSEFDDDSFRSSDLKFIYNHLSHHGFVIHTNIGKQSREKIKFYKKCVLKLRLDGELVLMTNKFHEEFPN